ncbi:MAG: hypothetical protein QE269_10910 [Fimbriimonas sp.]|jgi:hypothetical protein|nr:hypothetical protein [Fimbriimonas sp.]
MKQRKSPVALIVVAVFAGVGLMIAAKPFREENLSMEEKMKLAQERAQAEQASKMANAPAPKPDMKKEGSELKDAIAKSVARPTGPKGPGADDEEGGLPSSPVVIKAEDKVYIPTPNASATTSQWYDKSN